MKKLLVVLLALTFVVVMATAAFAVATGSVDGKVEWTMKNTEQFGGSDDGKITFDLTKDFGEGYSAGVKIKLIPGDNVTTVDMTTLTNVDVDKASAVAYDGNGWIKMVKDMYTLTLQTGGLGGNAANTLGTGYDMTGNAGLKVESSALMEGLALTMVLNDNVLATTKDESNDYYNYLLKAVYTADPLTLGFGYQQHTQPSDVTDSQANDMMALWAGYKLSDALNLGFEYASRPNLDGVAVNDPATAVKGSTGIMLKADFTAGALTVNGKAQIQTGRFYNMDPDDIGSTSAFNYFQFGQKVGTGSDPKDGSGVSGTAIKVDAGYQVTDAIKATVTVEDIMADAFLGTTGVKLTDKQLMSYKLGATDTINDKLSVEGWYAGYGDLSELGIKPTYTFVAGLVGTLELKNVANNAPGVADNAKSVNSYTLTVKATL